MSEKEEDKRKKGDKLLRQRKRKIKEERGETLMSEKEEDNGRKGRKCGTEEEERKQRRVREGKGKERGRKKDKSVEIRRRKIGKIPN